MTMAQRLPGNPSLHGITRDPTSIFMAEEPQCSSRKWYFSREEIEDHSPSRKDGIDLSMESHLRKLYCSFLKDLGKTLKVPQMTIATAMMFCHRFYLRQSHAKNDWQSVATFSMFLACKVEETPCLLKDVVVVAYELIYRWDPSAPRRIRQKELYDKQKESVVIGERLLLATMAFDLNIEHPYKPLVTALKRLDISHKDIAKVAWNFVNDWLCTTLCLQYKPHYIAAASMFLAAKFHKVKLPTENGKVWWLEFDISPKQLEEVIQHMLRLLEQTRKQTPQSRKVAESTAGGEKVISHSTQSRKVAESTAGGEKVISHSTQSGKINGSIAAQCSSSGVTEDSGVPCRSVVSKCSERPACGDGNVSEKEALQCQTSDCGSAHSVVEDGDSEIQPKTGESAKNMGFRIVSVNGGYSQIDVNGIREKMKRMQSERAASIKSVHVISDETDNKAWIERELENGIELEYTSAEKKQRRV